MRLTFIDLFCGIGGFHQALTTHADCVLACDIDENCRKVYEENFGIIPGADVRVVKENVPKHDILTAGFPCQPFSKSGSQLGFLDKIRGTLFEDIMDIVRLKHPSVIILENVRNFASHDEGRTLDIVRGALIDEDYHVYQSILSPHQFGIPQIRERIFIVALNKEKIPNYNEFRFPKKTMEEYNINSLKSPLIPQKDKEKYKITKEQRMVFEHWSILIKAILSSDKKFPSPTWSMEFGRKYLLDGKFPLSSRTKKELIDELKNENIKVNQSWKKEDLINLYPPYIRSEKKIIPEWKRRFILKNRKFWHENKVLFPDNWLRKTRTFKETYQKLEWHVGGAAKNDQDYDIMRWMIQLRPSGIRVSKLNHIPTLVAISQIPIIGPWGRMLTPREVANAQSFNDDYKLHVNDTVSYKQLGNSINVEVVRAIFMEILKLEITPNMKKIVIENEDKSRHRDFIQ